MLTYLNTLPLHVPHLLNYFSNIYLLITCSRVIHQILIFLQLVKKFSLILPNPKDHFRTRSSPRNFPILNRRKPVVALPSHFFKPHNNISHPRLVLQSFLYFRFQHHNHVCISLLSHSWHMSLPSHPVWFDYPNIIWCVVFYNYCILGAKASGA